MEMYVCIENWHCGNELPVCVFDSPQKAFKWLRDKLNYYQNEYIDDDLVIQNEAAEWTGADMMNFIKAGMLLMTLSGDFSEIQIQISVEELN
ncbi:MAG: hypothetical protein IJ192_09325 [Clostridia bacterium]|nr:hypothetical protein [Clostridia bacterium]